MKNNSLRVLIFNDDGFFIVQALELDIMAHGRTEKEALAQFDFVISIEIFACIKQNRDPRQAIGPAPARFFKVWDSCKIPSNPEILQGTPINNDRVYSYNIRRAFENRGSYEKQM